MNQPYPLTKEQVRLLLLYDFRIKKKAANSIADINTAFGPDTVSKSTAYDWYSRFQKGNESLEDQPRTGRPSEFDNSALQEALEANNRQTSRELADLLGVSHTTILHHLAELGKKAKLGCWVPHKLDDRDRQRRVDMAISLLSRSRRTDRLDSVVTGDEKWTFDANIRRKRQWVDAGASAEREPRQELHPKKVCSRSSGIRKASSCLSCCRKTPPSLLPTTASNSIGCSRNWLKHAQKDREPSSSTTMPGRTPLDRLI
jgi:transposase